MPQAWSSEEAPHLREIIGAFWNLWSFAIHQFSRHLLSDEILGRHMSANMSNSGKYVPYICIHSKWRLLPFAHIAPSQLHTDLGHCAKGHDGVYLVFFMLTCIRRTHGQILSTYCMLFRYIRHLIWLYLSSTPWVRSCTAWRLSLKKKGQRAWYPCRIYWLLGP